MAGLLPSNNNPLLGARPRKLLHLSKIIRKCPLSIRRPSLGNDRVNLPVYRLVLSLVGIEPDFQVPRVHEQRLHWTVFWSSPQSKRETCQLLQIVERTIQLKAGIKCVSVHLRQ